MTLRARNCAVEAAVEVKNGFAVYVLRSEFVEIAMIPELGARVVSLRNPRTGREWMWHPSGRLKLFRNELGDDFSRSSLVGMDECLPTIAPCRWKGKALPDHGEVWSAAWSVDEGAWRNGELKTTVALAVSPFQFARTVRLRENEISLSYELRNTSGKAESFLWALHPLLKLRHGDRLMLPKSSQALLNGGNWGEDLTAAIPHGGCAKLFAAPLADGRAGIHNKLTNDRLDFEWRPTENSSLGIWMTRGGWHGHHHFAIEPTNGDADSLELAVARKRCGLVSAGGLATWQALIRVGP